VSIHEFRDGKIVRTRAYEDTAMVLGHFGGETHGEGQAYEDPFLSSWKETAS
jgi:hypothetical protein